MRGQYAWLVPIILAGLIFAWWLLIPIPEKAKILGENITTEEKIVYPEAKAKTIILKKGEIIYTFEEPIGTIYKEKLKDYTINLQATIFGTQEKTLVFEVPKYFEKLEIKVKGKGLAEIYFNNEKIFSGEIKEDSFEVKNNVTNILKIRALPPYVFWSKNEVNLKIEVYGIVRKKFSKVFDFSNAKKVYLTIIPENKTLCILKINNVPEPLGDCFYNSEIEFKEKTKIEIESYKKNRIKVEVKIVPENNKLIYYFKEGKKLIIGLKKGCIIVYINGEKFGPYTKSVILNIEPYLEEENILEIEPCDYAEIDKIEII